MRIKLFLCFLFLWSMGTSANSIFNFSDKESPKASHIQLALGESEEAIKLRYPKQVNIRTAINGESGAIESTLYFFSFEPPKLGSAQIQAGEHSLSFNHVFSLVGKEDWGAKNGISSYGIATGFNASKTIEHDQARLNMMTIFKQLLAKGWHYHIENNQSGLKGQEALQYVLAGKKGSLDPSYVPTLDEWMLIKNETKWQFYIDHYHLSVSFLRKLDEEDPEQPDYLVIYELKTKDSF